jgi:bacterioferritin B
MMSKKVLQKINAQIGMEFEASIRYDAIASYFEAEALPTLSRHFFQQATEEREHAHRFLRYVLDAGGRVAIPAIPAPPADFASAEAAVQMACDGELAVTKSIHGIMDTAVAEKDYATQQMLQWFIEEQVEEMSSMDRLLRMVQRAGEKNLLVVEDVLADIEEGTKEGGK